MEPFEIVKKLKEIRKIPQFIFFDKIHPSSVLEVRRDVLAFVDKNPKVKEIDFVIDSPGGSADFAYILIRTLRNHFEHVNVIVPFWAKSAATLFAFGASKIIMGEFGEFGPLDVQLTRDDELPESDPQSGLIDEYSLTTIENRGLSLYQRTMSKLLKKNDNPSDIDIRLKKTILSEQIMNYVTDLYRPLFDKIDPYQIGEKARKLAIAERYAERILNQYNKENMKENIEFFVDYMVHECPDHGYNIDYSIMSIFFSNVFKSDEISVEYSRTLSQLTTFLFNSLGKFRYVGFYDDKMLKKGDIMKEDEIVGKIKKPKRGQKLKNEKQNSKK